MLTTVNLICLALLSAAQTADPQKASKTPVSLDTIYQINADWVVKMRDAKKTRNALVVSDCEDAWRKALEPYASSRVAVKGEVARVGGAVNGGVPVGSIGIIVWPAGQPRPERGKGGPPGVVSMPLEDVYGLVLLTNDRQWASKLKTGDKIEVEGRLVFDKSPTQFRIAAVKPKQ